MYQPINHIEYLVAQAGLPQRSYPGGDRQRPEHWQRDETYRANRRLVNPFLLSNQRQHTTSGSLNSDGERRLHANKSLEIAALLQLYQHLVLVANLLRLVPLRKVCVYKIIRQPFNIYVIRVIKTGIHTFSSNTAGRDIAQPLIFILDPFS